MHNNLPLSTLLLVALQGKSVSRMIGDVARLGIADLLADKTRPVSELAIESESNEDALYRVLRALSTLGVFAEQPQRCFANTEASFHLRRGVPGGLLESLAWVNCQPFWKALGAFDHSLRTGESAFTYANGEPLFEYLKTDSESARVFNQAMTLGSVTIGPRVAERYDFASAKTIVDMGGGHGALLKEILKVHKHLQGIVFDLPQVVAGGQAGELGERLVFQGGSFFETVPQGADLYTIKHIIHDWNDELSVQLLRGCREAMSEQGRVLVIEQVVSDAPEGVFAKLVDIEMLAITHNGRERTQEEFARLFEQAGLQLTRVIPTGLAAVCILEGTR
ncbi:MAG: methyltransferase [Thiofilum sp.]|uniref:methyltransferase n=1 Tax=Thiofilum sp. TaxID=2212733 RepID=UPI0025E868A9|nr:methyltransferase [Thiofilum sp.]MBK8452745.1 methyltransferase [Thiofilum sp.]